MLVGAGDIAVCATTDDEATASLLDGIAGTVFTAGDNAYENGSNADYQNCYDPSWGRHKARTHPVPGNHEYNTSGAAGYFNYFGAAAGPVGKGYYSYDQGDWHIVALNNYVSMNFGSEQNNWLQADLAATTQPCKLAYYHEPLYSSAGGSGSGGATTSSIKPLFTTLYNGHVDVVVNGHRHFYERLSPMDPDGHLDVADGIREFIAGTGGAAILNPTNAFPLSEVRFGNNTFGVLKLYLYSDSYAWKFIPVPGATLSDTGSYACHSAGAGVSATQSTVTASPTSISKGGQSTITVTVKDAFGRPISGATVALTVAPDEPGTTVTQPGPTGANGEATGTLTSTVLGEKTASATATLGGVTTAITQTAAVTVGLPPVITQTLLTAGNDTVNQKVYTTASISPAPNRLITVAVLGHRGTGALPSPTLSGGGMTAWTEVASVTFDPLGTPAKRLTIYGAMSPSPGSGPLTITFSAMVSGSRWIVSQWSGVDLSGVNGAGAIVQSGSTRGDAVTGLTTTLGAFGNANNVAYGVFGVRRNVATVTPGAGFAEIAEQPSGEIPPADLQAEWKANDNTIDATWPLNLNAGALGVEIRAAASGAGFVDASHSTVSAAPTSIAAGGTGSTITVTAKDVDDNPVSGATVDIVASGSGNTLTLPTGTTDETGVFTATLTSTVAETKTVSATANGAAINQHAAVIVTPGRVSASHSTVSASPTSIVVGDQTSTITVTVTDAFDNPIGDAAVALTATPANGANLTQPSSTDASGTATGALSSTVAEDKVVSATATVGGVTTAITQTATVSVTAQGTAAITHSLLTAGNNAVNQRVYTTASISPAADRLITVAVMGHQGTSATPSPTLSGGGMSAWTEVASVAFDAVGTPHKRLTIFRAMSAAPGSGPLTITFSTGVANCQWIVSQWGGVDLSGVNGAGAIVQSGSTRSDAVTGLTMTLAAFGNANNVAYGVFGVNRNVATVTPGTGFTEIAEQPSGEATAADLQAEWTTNDRTIDATWPLSLNAGAVGVEIKAGPGSVSVDASQSTVSASPTEITPGGAGSTIDVRVKDVNGNPISGATVVLEATGSGNTLTQPTGGTDAFGEATGTLSSTVAEDKIVSARANGTLIIQRATVRVTPGQTDADLSITKTDGVTSVNQGGTVTYTIVVTNAGPSAVTGATVSDAFPAQLSGVSWTCAPSAGAACPASGTGDIATSAVDLPNAGTATFTASGTVTGTGTLSNTATVTAPAGVTDPAGNNSATDNNTVITATADLSVTKTDGVTSVNQGGTVTYTIVVSNAGPSAVTGATVTDAFPAQLSGVSWACVASAGAACPASGTGDIATSAVDLPNGGTATFTASGTVTGTGTLSNTATVTAPAGVNDPAGNNSATDDNTVIGAVAPITHTLLTAGNNAVNQKIYTTATISPAPNTLVTVAVIGHQGTSAPPSATLSGGGMTAWTEVASVTLDPLGTPLKRLTIYRAMSASPGSGPLTITFSTTVSGGRWIVSQWDGVDLSGVNGAGAIGQTGSNRGDGVSGLTVALAPFANPNSVAYGVFGVRSQVLAVTPGTGFTEIAEQPSAEYPGSDLEAEWATNVNTIAATWAALNGGALGVEIKAASTAP